MEIVGNKKIYEKEKITKEFAKIYQNPESYYQAQLQKLKRKTGINTKSLQEIFS
jgi:hypothetical protein